MRTATKTATKPASKKVAAPKAKALQAAPVAKRVAKPTTPTRAQRARALPYTDSAIIVSVAPNPRREGTVQFDRYAAIQKFKGKTIGALLASAKGDSVERTGLRLAVSYGVATEHVVVREA